MNHWLRNGETAELLGIDTRTIKRWVKQPATREALGGIQKGRQFRIPYPADLETWRCEARWRLKNCGIRFEPSWKRDMRRIAQNNSRCYLESCRFWVAAVIKVLAHGSITQADLKAIHLLRRVSTKILAPLPRLEMEADKLKEQFPAQLSERGLSEQEVGGVMRYWPEEEHFEQVRAASTFADLETIWRKLDYWQAVSQLESLGQNPTTKNIGPLIHKDLMAHINDTGEQLPGIVIKNPRAEELRKITMASVYHSIAGRTVPLVTLDFRQKQNGLARRTVQKRYPQKQHTQKAIVAGIYQIRATIPGADEKPDTGMTQIRKPDYDAAVTGNHD